MAPVSWRPATSIGVAGRSIGEGVLKANAFGTDNVVIATLWTLLAHMSGTDGAEGDERLTPAGDLSGREEKASVNCVTTPSTLVNRESNWSTSAHMVLSNLTWARWIEAVVAKRRWQQSATTSIASLASSLVWRVFTITLSLLNCSYKDQ